MSDYDDSRSSCCARENGATIRCTDCQRHYHLKCVEISGLFAKNISAYRCKNCTSTGMHTIECEVRKSIAIATALESRPPKESAKTEDAAVSTIGLAVSRTLSAAPKGGWMSQKSSSTSWASLHHKGFTFCPDHWRNRRYGTTRFWRCKYNMRCPARIRTSIEGGEVVRELRGHNHPPMEHTAKAKAASHHRHSARNSYVPVAHAVPRKVQSSPDVSSSGFRHKGYAFCRERRSGDGMKQYWYCKAKHAAAKCPARIHTLVASGEVLQEVHKHNHPPLEATEPDEAASHRRHTGTISNVAVAFPAANHPKVPPSRIGYRHNGYAYNREYRTATKQFWSCKCKHKAVKCKARLRTSIATGEVLHENGEHNHPPMDGVRTTFPNRGQEATPNVRRSEKRRSGPSHSKKPFVSKSVNTSNNSMPPTTAPSKGNINPAKVVERFMRLDPAKRATLTSLFRAILDEMENDDDE